MKADLRPSNSEATKLIGATLLREFLEHRVAPLQEHPLPLWELGGADAALRLSSEALTDEDLAAALHSLVGGDVASPVDAPVPLFLCDDWEQVVDAMPTFNGEGLVPAAAPEDLAVLATVNLSSGSSSGEEEGEEEASDSEETGEDWGSPSPGAGPRPSAPCRTTTRPAPGEEGRALPRSRGRAGQAWFPQVLLWSLGGPRPAPSLLTRLLLPDPPWLTPAAGS